MKLIKSKKGIALLGVLVVAAVAAFGAYAYFTATGTGNGTATVGTSSNQLYVFGTAATALTPGGPSSSVTFHAWNYAANDESISNIHLDSVRACSVPWTLGSTASFPVPAASCSGTERTTAECGSIAAAPASTTADFYMADVALDPSADGSITANSNRALVASGTIAMNNDLDTVVGNGDGNQNLCKNQNLLLTFSTT